MKRSSRRVFEQRFHVDLIDEHARADTPRDLADLFYLCFVEQNTARIVKIRENDQTRLWTGLELFRVDTKTVFEPAFEAPDLRAKVQRRCQHRFVSRMLEQDLVARFNERRHRKVVGKSGPRRRYN